MKIQQTKTSLCAIFKSCRCNSNFVSDFIDFKKHIFNEFSVLKAKVSQGQNPPADDNERPSGRNDLVQSLHDRIDSLEKQLDCKNQIILKMIDTQQVRVTENANYEKIIFQV